MTKETPEFWPRHIGPNSDAVARMLDVLGFSTVDALIDATVPTTIRRESAMEMPPAATEAEVLAELAELADANAPRVSMIGLGYSGTITPPVIQRNVVESPAWYTAYTPYQPEISQGRLEALLLFQTMIEDLTGLPVANASLLDEPTAAAEAMTVARRTTRAGDVFLVDADTHPQTLAVLRTRAEPVGITIRTVDLAADDVSAGSEIWDGVFGALFSYPGSTGAIRDLAPLIEAAKSHGVTTAVAADLLALTRLTPPGEFGADVVVGSAQRFGVPMGFGGPHAGYMAVRNGLERTLPGRLVGVSHDSDGRPAYRLALQTREQHIRREKATSNICTAQVLLAVVSGLYAAYHGPEGLQRIADRVHALARVVGGAGEQIGLPPISETFFDTVTLSAPGRAHDLVVAAREAGVDIRQVDADHIGVSLDETTTVDQVQVLLDALAKESGAGAVDAAALLAGLDDDSPAMPAELRRPSDFLTHAWFSAYRSETAMMRYLRRLSDYDLALDRTMIPLGSCTMKLNAAAEMQAITWPGFAGLHPFAPDDENTGTVELIRRLEDMLASATGYDVVTVQPNAGSQGEFSGLLAIRGYHASRGESERDICLIPASAHGTNAASAVMAGMRVIVIGTDDDGNVDLADLNAKLDEHSDRVAALMITYPSTHGVFEEHVREVCAAVHAVGGQVYVDGANMNALVGVAAPPEFGADVSHLNLHKTFCIPHGGGGPGVGPIGVRAHLAPFLPNHPLRADAGPAGRGYEDGGVGPVSGAPWGSAGVLPIPYAYMRLMGPDGLREATQIAILSANYLAARLAEYYPVLYTGEQGLVAHECILDLREITRETGVTVDDVAKRLMDYGFHAPTMSFPVAGTLMVEPTESEDLAELDRFIDAMVAIRQEIDQVARGEVDLEASVLRNAPHTADAVMAETWDRPYSRETAAMPAPGQRWNKYWPPVSRIDGAAGDRNLICSCPPPEAFGD